MIGTDDVLQANIEAVKATIGCDQVAERETELRAQGRYLVGLCPLPDHDERTPSFKLSCSGGDGLYDRFACYGCGAHGDVLDLWTVTEGPFGNVAFAVADLAEKFGVALWRERDLHDDEDLSRLRAKRRAEKARDDAWTRWYFDREVVPEAEGIADRAERKRFLDRAMKTAGIA